MAAGLVAVLISIFLWRASKAECWALVGDIVCRHETDQRIVALSFDDGPTDRGVDNVLATLQARKVHATFFLIGKHVERSPAAAQRLVAAGMEVANHSYSHKKMVGKSEAHYRQEIERTDRILAGIGAKPNDLFRPPFGRKLIGLPNAAAATGHRIIMWDVADDATNHRTARTYADDILNRVRPGSIILMHPMYRHNGVERAALPLILDGLAARGYRVVTISALLDEQSRP